MQKALGCPVAHELGLDDGAMADLFYLLGRLWIAFKHLTIYGKIAVLKSTRNDFLLANSVWSSAARFSACCAALSKTAIRDRRNDWTLGPPCSWVYAVVLEARFLSTA